MTRLQRVEWGKCTEKRLKCHLSSTAAAAKWTHKKLFSGGGLIFIEILWVTYLRGFDEFPRELNYHPFLYYRIIPQSITFLEKLLCSLNFFFPEILKYKRSIFANHSHWTIIETLNNQGWVRTQFLGKLDLSISRFCKHLHFCFTYILARRPLWSRDTRYTTRTLAGREQTNTETWAVFAKLSLAEEKKILNSIIIQKKKTNTITNNSPC